MTIIDIKFKEQSSNAIFFNISYKNFFGTIKHAEILMKTYEKSKGTIGYFESMIYFTDTGKNIFYHSTLSAMLIRCFENHKNETIN